MLDTSNPYILTWRFFKEKIRKIFLIVVAVFIVATVIFTIVLKANSDAAERILKTFIDAMEGTVIKDGEISPVGLFFNNFRACAFSLAFGFVPFLFVPAISVLSNAMVSGTTFAVLALNGTAILPTIVFGILPHGIFELTAVFFTWSMSIFLCLTLTKRILLGKRVQGSVVEALKNILQAFVTVVIPLLIIAAIAETYLTPVLMNKFA